MEHRKRYLNQHKVELTTQTKIVMLSQKGVTGRPVVSGRDIITALALVAMKNASKHDAAVTLKETTASMN